MPGHVGRDRARRQDGVVVESSNKIPSGMSLFATVDLNNA